MNVNVINILLHSLCAYSGSSQINLSDESLLLVRSLSVANRAGSLCS